MAKPCPYCRCWDSCGREGGLRPPSLLFVPDVFDVYTALVDAHSKDPGIIDASSSAIAELLVRRGYFDRLARVVDVESSLSIVRSVERLF
jgi:hypothetical protein